MSPSCPCCGGPLEDPAMVGRDRLHGLPGTFPVAECRSCGAGVTLPVAGPAELAAFYPRAYGPYDPAGGPLRPVSAAIRRWQGWRGLRTAPLRAIRDAPPGRALDVGCGRGDLGALLIRRGWRVTGVEPSPQACEVARARGIDARCGTLADVELEPDAYDVAIFQHSLEHVSDPVAALRRVRAALAPGGPVLVSVPNFGSWQRRRFGDRWYHLDLPRHRVHFTPAALRRALEAADLQPVQMGTSTSTVGLPATLQYALVGRCLFPGGLALRAASVLCALGHPLARVADAVGSGGDVLHAVARRQD